MGTIPPMKFSTALKHYKTQRAIAQALGIKDQAVGQWKEKDRIPLKRARQLEALTDGKLKIDPQVYIRTDPPVGSHA